MVSLNLPKLETTTRVLVDGEEKVRVVKTRDISARVSLTNVQQVGSTIQGDVELTVDTGIGSISADLPFSIDTGLGNPIVVDLGSVSIPLIGDVDVVAEFSYDLPHRQICAALTLEGLISIAQTCTNF
jgi:hypothetical protein